MVNKVGVTRRATANYADTLTNQNPGAVSEVPENQRQALLASVHNATQGHNGVHRMCAELRLRGKQCRKMARDAVLFVKNCALCEKIGSAAQNFICSSAN